MIGIGGVNFKREADIAILDQDAGNNTAGDKITVSALERNTLEGGHDCLFIEGRGHRCSFPEAFAEIQRW